MTDPIDLRPSSRAFAALASGTADAQLGLPTPCDAYDVGDLIDHVALVAEGSVALACRDAAALAATRTESGHEHLADGWRTELAALLDVLGEAWADPAAWEGAGFVPGSDLSHETWGRIALTELVVHGWDLAVATGQPFSLPDATLRACWGHVETFVPNAPFPALWGPAVPTLDGAPLLDRIVAITGRTPV